MKLETFFADVGCDDASEPIAGARVVAVIFVFTTGTRVAVIFVTTTGARVLGLLEEEVDGTG
jgi:hypothetical protein